MSRGAKMVVVALAGIVALGTMAIALGPIIYRGMAIPAAQLDGVRPTMLAPLDGTADAAPSDSGAWQVARDSWVGYRLTDVKDDAGNDIVGRTNDVTGAMTIEDGRITGARFDVDVTSMSTGDSLVDRLFSAIALSAPGSETAELVVADADADAVFGAAQTIALDGTLCLRGVTRPISFELQTELDQDGGVVVGHIPVRLADYATAAESALTKSDPGDASIELSLTLQRG